MKKKNKNLLLVVLLIAILAMAVGYAGLSQMLKITGTANISADWDVKISEINEGALTGATTVAKSVAQDKLTATFEVDLAYPGASATYLVTVANEGTIDAKLESVTGIDEVNALAPTEVTYSIDAVAGDELKADATRDYTVTVTWADGDTIPTATSKTATITFNYVQAQ